MPLALQAEVESKGSKGSRSLRRHRAVGLDGEVPARRAPCGPRNQSPHDLSLVWRMNRTLDLTVLPPNSTSFDLV